MFVTAVVAASRIPSLAGVGVWHCLIRYSPINSVIVDWIGSIIVHGLSQVLRHCGLDRQYYRARIESGASNCINIAVAVYMLRSS